MDKGIVSAANKYFNKHGLPATCVYAMSGDTIFNDRYIVLDFIVEGIREPIKYLSEGNNFTVDSVFERCGAIIRESVQN